MLCGIIMGDGYESPYSMPVCLPCWFIVSIIQLRIIFLFIPITKTISVLLSIVSLAFLILSKRSGLDLYFRSEERRVGKECRL